MPSINLADIQQAADEKFGDYEITLPDGEVVTFKQAMRLPKAKRRKLSEAMDLQERAKSEGAKDEDIFDMFKDAFRISAVKAAGFKELEKAVGDDPAVWADLFNDYVGGTEAGEASPSES